MATTSSLGVGSGLDLNGLLTKLMQAEQQPLTLMSRQNDSYKTKISAYGTVSSKLSSLQTAANSMKSTLNLDAFKASSSAVDVATATATTGASNGSYNIHVASLAAAHTLNSTAFAATSTVVGTGTLRIGVGGSTFDVAIDSSKETLSGIRDAINGASTNTGVNATIITDVNGSRLALTSKETGTTHAISVAVQETGTADFTVLGGDPLNLDNTGLSKLAFVTGAATNLLEPQPATDTSVTINGITVNSASNTLDSAISGVSLKLLKAGDTTVTVGRDFDAISKLVSNFVTAYNDAQTTVRGMSSYDAETKTGGVLNGEGTARGIPQTLARALYTEPLTVTGAYSTLSELGITQAKDGTLSVNTTKLQTAITTDFTSVKSVLNGYGTAISNVVTDLTGTKGPLTSRVNGLNSNIKLLGERAERISQRLTQVEARYRKQFTGLDTMISQMNATSTYLAQQLAKL